MMHTLRRAFVALALLPLACTAEDNSGAYKLDQHYKLVKQEQAPADAAKIEVAEAFSYSCPHCYALEPFVQSWLAKKPAGVDFVRMPASLGHPVGLLRNKAYYAAETLGVADKFHKPLFDAIHTEKKPMETPESLRTLAQDKAGVSPAEFDGVFSGFMTDTRVRRNEMLLRDYGIASVPTIIVGGKYQTSAVLAGGYDKVFKVVDHLVEKLRKERKLK